MDVLDFRLRPPLRSYLNTGIFTPGRPSPFAWHSPPSRSIRELSMPLMLEEAKRAGVKKAVLWGRVVSDPTKSVSNDDVGSILKDHADFYVAGFAGICPRVGNIAKCLAEIERAHTKLGCKGITLEPTYGMVPSVFANNRLLYPLYEAAQEKGMILGMTINRGSGVGQTLDHSSPAALDEVAGDFPKLKIVVAHSFWPWAELSCGLAFKRENIYLHPDLYGLPGFPGSDHWVQAANTFLQDRILFGSAYPLLGVEEMVRSYLTHPYRPEVMEKVMFKNGMRLLGLQG